MHAHPTIPLLHGGEKFAILAGKRVYILYRDFPDLKLYNNAKNISQVNKRAFGGKIVTKLYDRIVWRWTPHSSLNLKVNKWAFGGTKFAKLSDRIVWRWTPQAQN